MTRRDAVQRKINRSYRLAQSGRFLKALQVLPPPPLGKRNSNWADYRLTLKLLTHRPVDAYDLLACFPQRLTRVGKENVKAVASHVDSLLDAWREEHTCLYVDYLAGEVENFNWREWDFAYLGTACGRPGDVVVRTFCFPANDKFREFAFSIIREAENQFRKSVGAPRVRVSKNRRPRKVKLPPVAMHGYIAKEVLPLPFVHYTMYGTFLAFSKTADSPAVLCGCSKKAIENLLALKRVLAPSNNTNPLRNVALDSLYFPEAIAKRSPDRLSMEGSNIEFVDGICHRCNVVTPTLRYCHEMYGGKFMQYHGWYVNQAFLQFGVLPRADGATLFPYLGSVSPAIVEIISAARAARNDYMVELQRLEKLVRGPARHDILPDEVVYRGNMKLDEAKPIPVSRRRATQAERAVSKFFENIARQEFGYRKVGEQWVSETMLFHRVARLFKGEEVIPHHRPDWLEGLELDVYVPGSKLGFEYQGQQHFHPVELWGGEEALRKTRQRDTRKRDLCSKAGVRLVEIDYTEPLTEDHIKRRVDESGDVSCNTDPTNP